MNYHELKYPCLVKLKLDTGEREILFLTPYKGVVFKGISTSVVFCTDYELKIHIDSPVVVTQLTEEEVTECLLGFNQK